MENTKQTQYHAVAYVRLSKEDLNSVSGLKAESNSISNQKQLILDYLKDKTDINLVSIREDDGYTGTDYDRPDFQRMMDDIRAGVVNCVIVKDLSRFGREYINAGKYIDRLFPYYGVRLIAINDGVDTITRSSADDFNIMVKNLMNDNYCRDISIKIRSQLQVKRKNGEFIGAFAPYGYEKSPKDKNKLVVDVYAAEVVRDIFGWKLSGINQDAIARRLNEQGILSPLEYKRSKGLPYVSRRSRIKTVNQNTAGERADNLFVCGYCGRKLQKSKGKVTHLFCLKAGVSSNADCTRLHEPIETLQSSVLEVVKMLAKTLAEKAVQVKANANREEPLLEKKATMLKRTLQRAQNSKLDLYEEYRNGRMTRDKFIAAQEERQTAIDSMRDELAATEATITKLRAGKEKAAVLEADAKGIQLLNEYRPKELRKLIEKVRVYENGRIEIDFRCHDDFTEKIIKAVAQLAG